MNNLFFLPTSLGEAIDKLTILDIKLTKIKDNRRIDVEIEYNLLYEKLKDFVLKYNDLYNSMKKVNNIIWDMMNELRDNDLSDIIYLEKCKETIEYNDIRFKIKNKINYISGSLLKEQKSYKINRLIIEIPINQELKYFITPIKYYSFFYDEIIIIYNGNCNSLKNFFIYDPTIIILSENFEKYKNNTKKFIKFSKNIVEKEEIYNIFEINDYIINKII
jgi:hypothetical protein